MLSLANARRRLFAWFHQPPDTTKMFDSWGQIVDRFLLQPVSNMLHHFTSAASESPTPLVVLERLSVVWIWLNKHPEAPEHEYIVIETLDSQDGARRLFVLDRTVQNPHDPSHTQKNSKRPDTSDQRLSVMEEGRTRTPTPTSTPMAYPPVAFKPPQHSMMDTMTLSAAQSSRSISNFFDKDGDNKIPAQDRFRGESDVLSARYAYGRNARQIKPKRLTMFELVVLANAVNKFAPDYSLAERNCYWYANMIFDAIVEISGLEDDDPEDAARKSRYRSLDSHLAQAAGRYKGWKISHTDPQELSAVVFKYKVALRTALSEITIALHDRELGAAYRAVASNYSNLASRNYDIQMKRRFPTGLEEDGDQD